MKINIPLDRVPHEFIHVFLALEAILQTQEDRAEKNALNLDRISRSLETIAESIVLKVTGQ